MIKFFFTFDKTIKSQNLKKKLLKQHKNTSPKKADIIIVAGGDGYMLNSLKNITDSKNHFMELTVEVLVF